MVKVMFVVLINSMSKPLLLYFFFCFSFFQVKPVDIGRVLTKNAYMLFYAR